ncbi:disulfide oxidoreductase [Salinicoccus halitifaciens]|uniref:Disulfide bond formation protein DsbB n=1 Tax=Salinicoccus halitifaciens TaxID=1073415 RepID=A0ABV2ECN6_9STAP|nr:disulfide oxidoreductase [Salinicoccus halitifaciens]MCD2138991.1 disulfide oxidoreductase [Salinicoccus halitifaciens]
MKNNKLFMQLIFLVSLIATLGSLYFSEVRMYLPCEMCWYQRIIMYPIVLISFIGLIRNDLNSRIYVRAFSGIGIITSAYHYSLQKFSFIADSQPACTGVDCTVQYINWFGFITIPFLALIAFILIFTMSFLIKK